MQHLRVRFSTSVSRLLQNGYSQCSAAHFCPDFAYLCSAKSSRGHRCCYRHSWRVMTSCAPASVVLFIQLCQPNRLCAAADHVNLPTSEPTTQVHSMRLQAHCCPSVSSWLLVSTSTGQGIASSQAVAQTPSLYWHPHSNHWSTLNWSNTNEEAKTSESLKYF